jgi:hypothetical protein
MKSQRAPSIPPTESLEPIYEGELAVLDSMLGTRDFETVRAALKRLLRSEWGDVVHQRFLTALEMADERLRVRALHALWLRDASLAGEVALDRLPSLLNERRGGADEPVLLGAMLVNAPFGEDMIVGLAESSRGVLGWWSGRHSRAVRALAAAGMELVTRRALEVTTPVARRRAIEVDSRWRIRKQSSVPPPPPSGVERLLDG